MSLPAAHVAVGMGVPFLAGLARFLTTKRLTVRLLFVTVTFMMFCALWAVIPDIPQMLPKELQYWESKIMHSGYADIFFFHGFLDEHNSEDRGLVEGATAIYLMFFLMLFAAAKTVRDNQKKIDSLRGNSSSTITLDSVEKMSHKDMVDIHCHILPGVDDGPDVIDESLAMCRRFHELGVVHVVATPHLPWREKYEIDKIIAAHNLLKETLIKENIELELSLGADIRISWDLIERLKNGSLLTLAKSRYFLLELDDFTVPPGLEDFIKRCNKEGFYPVLTHPERNVLFCSDYERIRKIAELPVLIQISSCSLVGSLGAAAKRAAMDWLKLDLVDVMASDAHAVNMRLEEFNKGLFAAQKIIDRKRLEDLVINTPSAIVQNKEIEAIKRNIKST